MIASKGGTLITISFSEFSTEPRSDVVRVFQCVDMECLQQQQLAELSGTYATVPVTTATTGFMKVVFTSDKSGTRDGFTASWSTVRSLFTPAKAYMHCL
jgi:hypothetical protein